MTQRFLHLAILNLGALAALHAQTAPLAINGSCPGPVVLAGGSYSLPLTATGASGNYRWSLQAGSAWLSVAPATGASTTVSGTPPGPGLFPFSVLLTDLTQVTRTFTCVVQVLPALTISGMCPGTVPFNGSYTLPLTAGGGNGNYQWSLAQGAPPWLSIAPAAGRATNVSGTPPGSGPFPFSVILNDTAGSQPVTFTCSIVRANPPLTISGTCPGTVPFNGSYTFPLTAGGGNGNYQWALAQGAPVWLGIAPGSGSTTTVSGTPPGPGPFPFSVTLTDTAGTQPVTFACSVTRANPPLTISGTCPITAVAGTPYSQTLTAAGGNGDYRWNVDTPGWLGITPAGGTAALSGTPPLSGAFPIAVTLNDTAAPQQTATFRCSITVIPALIVTSACQVVATVNSAFVFPLSVTGGVAPYNFAVTSGSLPPQLTLNASTGLISGTPINTGNSPFTIRVTDSSTALQQSKTLSCGVSVNQPPARQLEITSACPIPAPLGSPYFHLLSAAGGSGSFTWTIASASLPAGLVLRGNVIAGVPAGPPGTANFSIQVTSDDQTATQVCSLAVTGPKLQIASACPADGTQGIAYGPLTLNATGGSSQAYAFSIVNGALPPGLTLSAATITGTPLGPLGPSVFAIQVTNGNDTATIGPCSMNIAGPRLAITGTCPANAQIGTPLAAAVSATGGAAPYRFSFNSGSTWLSLRDGVISGTPPTEETSTYTVTVADAANSMQTLTCSFPVTRALQIAGQCPSTAIALNAPFTTSLTAVGGNSNYTWRLTGPPWLSLSSTTGSNITASGTPPSTGSSPLSVTLTDSIGSPAATLACSLTVAQALQITLAGACPASPITLQSTVSLAVSANGGAAPYSWTLSGPAWLTLSTATGADTTASGRAITTPGDYSFTLTLNDAAGSAPATVSCPLTVAALPAVPLSGPANSGSGQDQTVTVGIPANFPSGVQGRLTLTFSGDGGLPNDPAVQFQNGSRVLDFTSPTAPQLLVKTGTVAGVITVTPSFTVGGADVTPANTVPLRIQIARTAPVITSADCVRTSSSSFNIILDGYTNTREATDASFTFQPAAGANLGTTQISVPVTQFFNTWFTSPASANAGGTFRSTHTFNTQGNAADIGSVSVRLTNSAGSSAGQSVSCRVQ